MTPRLRLPGVALIVAITSAADPVMAAEEAATARSVYTFGTYATMSADAAKDKLVAGLKAMGGFDQAGFDKVWGESDRPVQDRVVRAIVEASPAAAAALAEARAKDLLPPSAAPPVLTDERLDPFVRANLAAAYAEALARRRVYEESLAAAAAVEPERLVNPSAFFFYKAVAEHGLGVVKPEHRSAAQTSINRLLDDVLDPPDRYRMVATLMYFDIQGWSKDPKDLSNIGRLMDNSGRRLDLARGDKDTQDIQKRIVFRLDEKIKELEKQQQGGGGGGGSGPPNGGQCPGGGAPGGGSINPSNPAGDSNIMGGSGEGKVDEKKLREYAENWGKLPAAERAKAVQEITRDLPPKFKPMIEEYFKSLNRIHNVRP